MSPYRRYWNFYLPLLLTSIVMQSETFFQNRTLAQYGTNGREIAVFANASGVYQSLCALLIFIPQVITVLAVNRQSARRCQIFSFATSLLMAIPLGLAAYTTAGEKIMSVLLAVPMEIMSEVQLYLRWLAPLIIIDAQIFHNSGRLIAAHRPQVITRFNFLHLFVIVSLLHWGLYWHWPPIMNLAIATITANLIHVIGLQFVGRNTVNVEHSTAVVSYAGIWQFFWPMAITGLLFAVSRPIIYRYVNFLPPERSLAIIAALRVAFDTGFIFQAPVNQIRNLFTSFSTMEQPAVRRFSLLVSGIFCVLIALVAFTPLNRCFFGSVLGLQGEVLSMTTGAFAVLCLNPLIIAIRNIYHGKLMNSRHTFGMAIGGGARVGLIWLLTIIVYHCGMLNHITGAALMLSGFVVEMIAAGIAARKIPS